MLGVVARPASKVSHLRRSPDLVLYAAPGLRPGLLSVVPEGTCPVDMGNFRSLSSRALKQSPNMDPSPKPPPLSKPTGPTPAKPAARVPPASLLPPLTAP